MVPIRVRDRQTDGQTNRKLRGGVVANRVKTDRKGRGGVVAMEVRHRQTERRGEGWWQ